MDQNESAKGRFIEAYFFNLERRIKLTKSLYEKQDAKPEALLLCCCYIEGIGNWFYSEQGATETFVRVLRERGDEPFLLSVHPKRLAEALPKNDSRTMGLATSVMTLWGLPPFELLSENDFISRASNSLSSPQLEILEREVWRGTIAALTYGEVRGRLVHSLGAGIPISFDQSTWRGNPAPPIDFQLLYGVLGRIFAYAKQISLSTNKFFGVK